MIPPYEDFSALNFSESDLSLNIRDDIPVPDGIAYASRYHLFPDNGISGRLIIISQDSLHIILDTVYSQECSVIYGLGYHLSLACLAYTYVHGDGKFIISSVHVKRSAQSCEFRRIKVIFSDKHAESVGGYSSDQIFRAGYLGKFYCNFLEKVIRTASTEYIVYYLKSADIGYDRNIFYLVPVSKSFIGQSVKRGDIVKSRK